MDIWNAIIVVYIIVLFFLFKNSMHFKASGLPMKVSYFGNNA